MRMVLLGPPGCGKGTQADRLARHFQLPRLTTGEMLRIAVRENTPLGQSAKGFMDQGALVPDVMILDLMRERMAAGDCRRGYILDGFPRNRAQAEALDQMLRAVQNALDHALLFEVPEGELLRRLSGRRECRQCGTAYQIAFQPPRTPGRCDRCGGELYQREDDREETIRKRLAVYAVATTPVIDYYADQGLLRRIAGKGPPEAVFGTICSLMVPKG